jgi:hypothetical protein
MKLTQCDVILKAMLENKDKKVWTAKDFQSGKYFVGYEASARMSDLVRLHPDIFIIGKDGRFRTLEINWEKDLSEYFKVYGLN